MEALGFNLGIGLIQFIIVGVTVGLPVISVIDLAGKKLTGTPLALWVLIICAIPVLGSVAYWIVRPAAEGNS
jgi:hypothetical protein